ncbi:MAG: GtrA family protein [Clostridia bacterium]|nr:GtrA family protein [Clostridia bacterium]MBQ4322929.1 GtrA family protein [Clostridia bacterium]
MRNLFQKYKEAILYLVFGVATTAVNIVLYFIATALLALSPTVGNVIAWLGSVLFAFVTNKLFVFESKSLAPTVLLKEGSTFFASRLVSGVLDIGLFELLMWAGLNGTMFGSEGFFAKILVNVVVIIVNYVLSKLIVFRKKKD